MLIPLLMAVFAFAQSGHEKPQKKAAAGGSAHASSASKPVARPKSFDLSAMDKSVSPCQDFYEYACGNWRKNNPIPPDEARWGRFNELADYNRQILHQILQKDSANNPKRNAVQQKIGDMYESCMDEKAVNAKGSKPIKPELDRVAAITNKDQLMSTVA
ncbi:MAG TPA: M13 family metallopeptidase N-terminal domain-containing protein, partial [Candidatus Angelobacter sp.]|nr:M13 family metallopeptidase N-terminal domain-containing protein [Candidatus Angelobacter sp.]